MHMNFTYAYGNLYAYRILCAYEILYAYKTYMHMEAGNAYRSPSCKPKNYMHMGLISPLHISVNFLIIYTLTKKAM